jgi:hypothetical protein
VGGRKPEKRPPGSNPRGPQCLSDTRVFRYSGILLLCIELELELDNLDSEFEFDSKIPERPPL